MSVSFTVNGRAVTVEAAEATPLLYVLRNDLGLTGARFGCGDGLCGACAVILEDRAIQACDTPLSAVAGKALRTIEGLDPAHPLRAAMIAEQAGQCGYCMTGVMMRAVALLEADPDPSRETAARALDGNLCRCGSHPRILRAIARAAGRTGARS